MAGKYPVTPKGEFFWSHIMTPDTTFKAEGLYHIKLRLRGEEAENFKKLVDDAHTNWKEKCLQNNTKKTWQEYLPYKKNMDAEGMEDGIDFHFKLKASGTNGRTGQTYTQRPVVVGPDKAPLPNDLKVGNRSNGKIAYELAPYEHGTTLGIQLRLRMVQVITLEHYVGDGNASDVFDVEEGDLDLDRNLAEGMFNKEGAPFSTDSPELTQQNSGDF